MTQAKISYIGMGKKDAEECRKAYNKADGVMRRVLQDRAPHFMNVPGDMPDWLDGFGGIMGPTKKSEAKAVFQAYAANDVAVKGFKGEFNAWVTECRKIRDEAAKPKTEDGKPVETAPETKKVDRQPKVTDKQQSEIESKVIAMKPKQVEAVLEKATEQLIKVSKKAWEHAVVSHIQDLAKRLGDSEQPIYKNLAEAILAQVEGVAAQVEATKAVEVAKTQHHVPQPLAQAA